ncbi:MAG: hypothetical protein ABIO40_06945 [Devosia sp.]
MRSIVSKSLAATALATLMLAAPLPFELGIASLGVSAAYAGNGKGNGNGNGNGGGGGNGGGQSHSQSAQSNDDTSSSNKPEKAKGHGSAAAADEEDEDETTGHGKGNLHSKLAGLNSLNRNINGLMNSSDPRMVEIREFVQASADLAAAEANLATANEALAGAGEDYDALVSSFGLTAYDDDPDAYADNSLGALQARLDMLNGIVEDDPDNLAAADEALALALAIDAISTSPELAALQEAQSDVDLYTAEVEAGEAATTDAMLVEALMIAANDNRVAQYGDGYVDAELLDWAKQQLGVGDYDGLIDAYVAQL